MKSATGKFTARQPQGFTLIEMMIVVAIIAVISAIAIPQYKQYVIRGNRAAVESFMMDVSSKQKQYLLDARTYAADLATLSIASLPPDVTGKYTVSICIDVAGTSCTVASSPPFFEITATPVAGGPQAGDGNLTLDDADTKSPPDKW